MAERVHLSCVAVQALLLLPTVAAASGAQVATLPLPAGVTIDQRVHALAEELRCVVCQNQTLAESDSELARDLRQQLHEQLAAGRSDEQAVQHLVQRYGEFVRYRPVFAARTLVLWAGPALLLALGLGLLTRRLRRAATTDDEGLGLPDNPAMPPQAASRSPSSEQAR